MTPEFFHVIRNQITESESRQNADAVTKEGRNLNRPSLPAWFLEQLELDAYRTGTPALAKERHMKNDKVTLPDENKLRPAERTKFAAVTASTDLPRHRHGLGKEQQQMLDRRQRLARRLRPFL